MKCEMDVLMCSAVVAAEVGDRDYVVAYQPICVAFATEVY